MALSYRTLREIPRLHDYAAAAAHEAKVKPIRGDKDGTKPIGKRNQKYNKIRREENGDIVAIYGSMYVARWKPNGDIVLYDHGWGNKATSNELIRELTGIHCETYQGKMWFKMDGQTHYLRPSPRPRWDYGVQKWIETEPSSFSENIFRRVATNPANPGYLTWTYVNPPTITTHVVNRKGAKAVRARYALGLTYVEALAKLRRDTMTKWPEVREVFADKVNAHIAEQSRLLLPEQVSYWSLRDTLPTPTEQRYFNHTHAAEVVGMLASTDPADHFRAFIWLSWNADSPEAVVRNTERALIMHHHDEWLTKREGLPTAKTHDRYAWAIPAQSQTT